MGFRVDRTSEDLKRELTDIIRHVKDPRGVSSILTIIKVDLSQRHVPLQGVCQLVGGDGKGQGSG